MPVMMYNINNTDKISFAFFVVIIWGYDNAKRTYPYKH
jgi:hypothetical protein